MRTGMLLVTMLVLCGCGASSVGLNNDELSDMLSISGLVRQPIADAADPSQVAGLKVDFDVIHVGYVIINLPFTVTWSLIDGQGSVYGSASERIAAGLQAGASVRVSLILRFPTRPSLEGLGDVVTFDLVR